MDRLEEKINEVRTFVKFWDDEMSTDAREWIVDILAILESTYVPIYQAGEDELPLETE